MLLLYVFRTGIKKPHIYAGKNLKLIYKAYDIICKIFNLFYEVSKKLNS